WEDDGPALIVAVAAATQVSSALTFSENASSDCLLIFSPDRCRSMELVFRFRSRNHEPERSPARPTPHLVRFALHWPADATDASTARTAPRTASTAAPR